MKTDYFIEAVEKLNQDRLKLVEELLQSAKKSDGSFNGAIEYLDGMKSSCIAYDDENRWDENHIQAWNLQISVLNEVKKIYNNENELRKKEKIW